MTDKRIIQWLVVCSAVLASASPSATELGQTKAAIESTLAGQNTGQDAVRLTFLVLNKDGTPQMERAAHYPFYTGEIFRLKIVASQSGSLQLTNISPTGKVTTFRTIPVQAGIAASYPPENSAVLQFNNSTGDETLRVASTPSNSAGMQTNNGPGLPASNSNAGTTYNQAPPSLPQQLPTTQATRPDRPSEFFSDVQGKAYSYPKDIQEIVLETPQATYLTRPAGSGILQFDVVVQHRNQRTT